MRTGECRVYAWKAGSTSPRSQASVFLLDYATRLSCVDEPPGAKYRQILEWQRKLCPTMSLPSFRYHPDPIATGSVKPSEAVCTVCGRARGLIYAGPVYGGEEDYDEAICPWCIADGTAHDKLGVEFADASGVGGYGVWEPVPDAVVEEVAFRTPCFTGWQQELAGSPTAAMPPNSWRSSVGRSWKPSVPRRSMRSIRSAATRAGTGTSISAHCTEIEARRRTSSAAGTAGSWAATRIVTEARRPTADQPP